MTATAKSPLTGAIGDSQCGGFLPAKLKFAGFDAVIIKGRAAKPVYLWIDEGKAKLRDASHLWGKITGVKVDKVQFEAALQEYYHQCGWDESSGIPKRETLERLGLKWVADQLGI
jgi:aldehyde:ferredoxin oxidoreductase